MLVQAAALMTSHHGSLYRHYDIRTQHVGE